MTSRIQVLVVDDHPVVRNGLAAVLALQGDIEVVGSAGCVRTAVELQQRLLPDVTLLDYQLGPQTAVDILTICAERGVDVSALVLSSYDGAWRVHRCLRGGAKGYLLKETPQAVVVNAIRSINKGLRFIPPEIADRAAEAMALDALTAREFEVLAQMAKGRSNKAIAKALRIGEGTVKTHVNSLMSKIQAKSRTEAVVRAFRLGLARPYGPET